MSRPLFPSSDAARAAWLTALREAAGRVALDERLVRPTDDLLRRFDETYARLCALSRARRRRLQRQLQIGLAGAALLLALGLAPIPVLAGGVVGTGNAGSCTDAALDTALTGGGSVTFNCGAVAHTITVATTKTISADTTIDGGGLITLSGGNAVQVLSVNSGVTLTLKNATISGGVAANGGGIYNAGELTVQNSTLSGNSASTTGGGIYNNSTGTLTLQNSTISGNSTPWGGGIYNYGTLTVQNSTISGNTAMFSGGGGGGILNKGTLTVQNSTLSGNSARWGGGFYIKGAGTTTVIENSTISGNTAGDGGGIYTYRPVTIQNSIVALQAASANDCTTATGGSIVSQGYNIESNQFCDFTATGDQQSKDAAALKLGALADNGGPTQTMALDAGSVAIDQIPNGTNGCIAGTSTDQRGYTRAGGASKGGTACDVGAYEYEAQTPTAVALRALAAADVPPTSVWGAAGVLAAALASAWTILRRQKR
jgi:hypothetical protein